MRMLKNPADIMRFHIRHVIPIRIFYWEFRAGDRLEARYAQPQESTRCFSSGCNVHIFLVQILRDDIWCLLLLSWLISSLLINLPSWDGFIGLQWGWRCSQALPPNQVVRCYKPFLSTNSNASRTSCRDTSGLPMDWPSGH